MNISSLSSTPSLGSISPLTSSPAVSGVSTADGPSTAAAGNVSGSDKTQLTKLGDLMSKLQNLESTDPAKAKQVLTSIASALTDKANSSNDPHLQALANKFTQAADTGDLSALKPQAHHHHGGHHQEAAPPASAAADASATSAAAPTSTSTTSGKTASYVHNGTNQLQDLESIISNALSSAG